MGAGGLQVDDHMMVDVAWSVLLSARVEYLLLQDEDGRCSGLVTRAQLAAQRSATWYSDHTRLRDISSRVNDAHGCTLGALAPSH
jgi:hypothetical protein